MHIRIGYDIALDCPQPTPLVLMLRVHPDRGRDLLIDDAPRVEPGVPTSEYVDVFGNRCTRLVAPAGRIRIAAQGVVADTGLPDAVTPGAVEHGIHDLPPEAIVFLIGSRYCESDRLSESAWQLFGQVPPGWSRVQAICDHVHQLVRFDYLQARVDRTACDVVRERVGVCRDFAHLAVAFCRAMNVPARYCTGYLGDIGVPPDDEPMDFSAWFEAYLGGAWYTFDARHNHSRIGRIVVARGRDAADVAMITSFGRHTLAKFAVVAEEIEPERSAAIAASG